VGPITVAVLNDCQLVVDGIAAMLAPYGDRVRVVELDCQLSVAAVVDVGLYDAFAVDSSEDHLRPHLMNPNIGALAVYTWRMHAPEVRRMLTYGVRGVLAKHLDAPELVAAIEAVHAGAVVVSPAEPVSPEANFEEQSNPLPGNVLTTREAEVVALIALGRSNAEISEQLFISANTLKTYIRSSYRKMGVERRSQAVAWAVDHGLRPTRRRTLLEAEKRPAS